MGRSRTRAARQPVPKPTKSQTKPREKTPEKAKAEKETPDRTYYRETWDFDPVADARDIGDGWRQLEALFPLEHDPPLQAAGVTIGARVDWRGDEVRNRIMFRRENTVKKTMRISFFASENLSLRNNRCGRISLMARIQFRRESP